MEVLESGLSSITIDPETVSRKTREFRRRFPSLFNYATPRAIMTSEYWSIDPDLHSDVIIDGVPIFSEIGGLDMLGENAFPDLDFMFQVTYLVINLKLTDDYEIPFNDGFQASTLPCDIRVNVQVGVDRKKVRTDQRTNPRQSSESIRTSNDRSIERSIDKIDKYEIRMAISDHVQVGERRIDQLFSANLDQLTEIIVEPERHDPSHAWSQQLLFDTLIIQRVKHAIRLTAREVTGDLFRRNERMGIISRSLESSKML